jgi:hypothetical protein
MSDKKPHYFELVMNSYSEGELNQEVVIVREYAVNSVQLTAKQMAFTKEATVPIVQAVINAMDKMSAPLQEEGLNQMMEAFEEFSGAGVGNGGKSKEKVKR